MTEFDGLARALEEELVAFYARAGEPVEGATRLTIQTNSTLVERRAAPLVTMLGEHGGVPEPAGLRLLDMGCGFGALSIYFASLGASVTGIDPNEERLAVGTRVASEHDLPVELHRGRMERLRLDQGTFDVVVANNSLCYVVDRDTRRKALAEVLRVLRPGGTFIFRNPNRWNPIDQFTGWPLIHLLPPRTAERVARRAGRKRSYCRLMSPPRARRELRHAGFEQIVQPGFLPESGRSDALKAFARYQHFVARRPQRAK